jgi:phosphatidylserine decarboxylase
VRLAPSESTLRAAVERAFATAFSSPALSRVAARAADLRLPGLLLRALIRAYVRAYRVDLSEAAEPLRSYATFNAFFTRRLRDGARPIAADPAVVVSPCDARLQSWGALEEHGRLEQIKGRDYSVAALLGSEDDARDFRRGVHATLYLSPAMYHRVHVPADGRLVAWRYVPGRLFPVNGPSVRRIDGLFTRNERVIVRLDSERFGALAVVLVGAANVGRISLAFTGLRSNTGRPARAERLEPPLTVSRGDELGAFNLGSTVVLLAADPTLLPAGATAGDRVHMGQALWRRE